MCGFTGWFDPSPASQSVLEQMTASLAHRGPDAEGFFYQPPIALGHRRLSIVDLAHSHQPMVFGSYSLAYNGEVYNFRELRQELAALGHQFQTNGDTEVVLHALIEWRESAFPRLQGMFALAFWNGASLLLARDHLGVKPLYFSHQNDKLFFASEIKALLIHPAISRDINLDALGLYLECQYIPAPYSIFKHIEKLPPAHYLKFEAGQKTCHRYWIPSYLPKHTFDEETAINTLAAHLRRSVQSMLIADVPIGVFVSGGIDSSLIATLAQEVSGEKATLFSLCLGEEAYAAHLRAHLGANYHPLSITPADMVSALDDLFDEPLGDQAALPTLLLSKLTRKHVKVVLTGEGADEIFGGYSNYVKRLQEAPLAASYGTWPFQRLYPYLPMKLRKSRLCKAMGRPLSRRYATIPNLFDRETHRSILTFPTTTSLEDLAEPHFHACDSDEYLDKMLHIDQNLWLADDLLTKVDRATMTHSIEARVPYLDHHLVEFSARLPAHFKIHGAERKYLIRRVAEKCHVPQEIIHRSKQGFVLPLHTWMAGPLKPWINDAFLTLGERGLFRGRFFHKNHHGTRLFALLSLELWLRKFAPDFRV
jgi:asparagine synthase (glutamine-hydrolysing)